MADPLSFDEHLDEAGGVVTGERGRLEGGDELVDARQGRFEARDGHASTPSQKREQHRRKARDVRTVLDRSSSDRASEQLFVV